VVGEPSRVARFRRGKAGRIAYRACGAERRTVNGERRTLHPSSLLDLMTILTWRASSQRTPNMSMVA
jgi:hypothetical protein